MSENNFAKKHQMKLRARKNNEVLSKKLIESSESDDSSWEENEEQEESSEYEPEINLKEYRTLLSKIFPSKYITEKAKNTPQNTNIKINKKVNKKENKKVNKKENNVEEKKEDNVSVKISEKTKTKPKKYKRKNVIESDEDSNDECEKCNIVEEKKITIKKIIETIIQNLKNNQ